MMGYLDSVLDFNPPVEEPKIVCDVTSAHGFMVSKFMVFPDGHVRMINVQGDIEGVTGYTKEEFINSDIMNLLALKQDTVKKIFDEVEGSGICNKMTKFKKKDGSYVDVWSTVIKVFENTYVELTTLSNKIMQL